MASLKFYLNEPRSKKKTSIYFRFSYGAYEIVEGNKKYLNLRYFTSESIDPVFWIPETGRAKESKKFPQYPEFNTRLKNIEDTAFNVLRRLQNDDIIPTNKILKTEFDKIWKATKDKTDIPIGSMEIGRASCKERV